ncbi:glucosaminidase domain-containing protein [Halonatronum saccharophilum]|uniref:glucosaminidase domain-containing protein n=1 Tax=Halonatronum saccharophilum TaxID=150060 RepID=UPI0004AE08E3|nr:glucosaminidase domain-containing protein [Halonatronum saccharophilum]
MDNKKASSFLKIAFLSFVTLILLLNIYIRRIERLKDLERIPSETVDLSKDLNSFKKVSYDDYKEWKSLFEKLDYDMLSNKDDNIPKIKIANLPHNIHQIDSIERRKSFFINTLLLGAYYANQEVLNKRRTLRSIENQKNIYGSISKSDEKWLEDKAKRYYIYSDDKDEIINELYYKMDTIPISLIIALAALESGWGTSRFTIEANNIFGEWTFLEQIPGVIPRERPANATYRIRKFETVQDSIKSFLLNLNRHFAYEDFRYIRDDFRRRGKSPDSIELVEGLLYYSIQRELYITKVQDVIRSNDLQRFDFLLDN